jgi:subtilisin family serine protease
VIKFDYLHNYGATMGIFLLLSFVLSASSALGGAFLAEINHEGIGQAKRFAGFKPRKARFSETSNLLSFNVKGTDDAIEAQSYLRNYIDAKSIKYVVVNSRILRSSVVADPSSAGQWFHDRIGTSKAWETTQGSPDVMVAILDTGVDYSHTNLKLSLATNTGEIADNGLDDDQNGYVDDSLGYDFVDNDSNTMDETSFYNPGQGTHLTGIVAAQATSQSALVGIAPLTKVLPVRVLNRDGQGNIETAVRGIDYAISRGAKVIVMGWSANVSRKEAAPLEAAIRRASEARVLVIAAAGNQGRSNDNVDIYPANLSSPNLIAVSATNQANVKPVWANFGLHSVDMLAPGDSILSTLPQNHKGRISGTAFSAAMVAGVAALILSEEDLSPAEVKAKLQLSGILLKADTLCPCRVHAELSLKASFPFIYPAFSSLKIGQKNSFKIFGGDGAIAVSDSSLAEIDSIGNVVAKKPGTVILRVPFNSGIKTAELRIAR